MTDSLEPDAMKVARPVLRGEGRSDALPPTRLSAKRDDTALYRTFLGELNTSTPELQEVFAQEVLNLTDDEQVVLKDNDFFTPDVWTDAARVIYTKMLARAAAKAKKIGKGN